MSGHKFKIGQFVNYLGRQSAFRVYQVTQLLPPEGKYFSIASRTSPSRTNASPRNTSFAVRDGAQRASSHRRLTGPHSGSKISGNRLGAGRALLRRSWNS